MSEYRAKVDWDQTLADADKLSPQPYSPGLQASRRTLMGDGSILDQGLYVEWIYNVIEDSAQLITILTKLGLNTAKSRNVTIYTRDDLYVYHTYNGVAQRPLAVWENYFARNVVIRICNLRLIS